MKRLIAIAIIILLATSSTWAQEKIISGRIITNSSPVEYAYLINMRTKKAAVTQTEGRYALPVQNGDTLLFRCLGYQDSTFYVNPVMLAKDSVILRIRNLDYALKEVKIRGFMSYAMFKQAFANVKLDDKDKPMRFNVTIDYANIDINNKLAPGQPGFGVDLGKLVSLGSSLLKSKEKVDELNKRDALYSRYDRVTSHENLQAFTGLKGTALDSFVVFLRTQYKINPLASEYDMLAKVKLAYTDFLAVRTAPKDTTSAD